MVVHALDEIVHLQLAKAAAEGEMLLGGQVLVAEEDHAIFDQRLADFANHAVIEVAATDRRRRFRRRAHPKSGWTSIVR